MRVPQPPVTADECYNKVYKVDELVKLLTAARNLGLCSDFVGLEGCFEHPRYTFEAMYVIEHFFRPFGETFHSNMTPLRRRAPRGNTSRPKAAQQL
eukprot:gene15376-10966_t